MLIEWGIVWAVAAVAVLAGLGLWSRARLATLEPYPNAGKGAIRVYPSGRFAADRGARAILSLPPEREDGAAEITAALGSEFLSKIAAAAAGGGAFDSVFEAANGRTVRASGAIHGLTVRVLLTEEDEKTSRLTRVEAELERERREAEFLREGLRAAGVIVWSRADGPEPVWEEQSASALAPEAQKTLVEASVAGQPRRVSIDETEEEIFEVSRSDAAPNIAVARRVDDLARTERMMNRLLNTMSETFAHLSVGLMIFDNRRRLSLFNPRIIEIFGEDAARLASRPRLDDLLDRWRAEGTLPERLDFADWKASFCDLSAFDEAAIAEETWHLVDGRSLRVLRRLHPSGGLAIVIEDVTESVSLRRNTASERAASTLTTDLLTEGIAIAGPDGRFRMTNRAFRVMWAREGGAEIEPEHLTDFTERTDLSDDAAQFWRNLLLAVTGGGGRETLERQISLTDRRIVKPRVSSMPDGATLMVFADVTASEAMTVALKQKNEALEHADDMRAALVDQISHQLRTPLNAIYGFSQILAEDRCGELSETQKEYATAIVASAAELTEVVDEMADLISIGASAGEPERLDPLALIRDVAAVAAKRCATRGISIDVDPTTAPPREMIVERLRLRQALFNAFIDAFTHTANGAAIHVEPRISDDRLTVEITHQNTAGVFENGLAFALGQRAALLCGGDLVAADTGNGRRRLTVTAPLQPAEQASAEDLARAAAPDLAGI